MPLVGMSFTANICIYISIWIGEDHEGAPDFTLACIGFSSDQHMLGYVIRISRLQLK